MVLVGFGEKKEALHTNISIGTEGYGFFPFY